MATTFRASELLSQTSASLSGFFTAQKTERDSDAWPNPELSIGRFISKYGKVSCWETKGPARAAFDDVAPKIKDYLERSVEPISRWVTWSIYMLGKTPNSADPTIMFCCEVAAHRKEVRNMVRESGLLNGYRGIKTGHMPRAPDFEQLIPLAPAGRLKSTEKVEIFAWQGSGSQCNGREIFVGDFKTPATIGGVVKSRGKFYYTTAAHVFRGCERRAEGSAEDEDDEDNGIDIDGFDDSDFDSDGEVDSNSNATPEEVSSRLKEAPSLPKANTSSSGDTASDYMSLGNPFLSFPDESGPNPGLDYALIEVSGSPEQQDNQVFNPNFSSPERGMVAITALASPDLKETREILSAASGEYMTGILSGAPIYCRSPNSTQFTMNLNAVFDLPLKVGDCGSWVVDAQTGNLYGHIVAGSPGTGRAIVGPFD